MIYQVNATITYPITDDAPVDPGNVTYDPVTGEPIFSVTTSTIQVSIEEATERAASQAIPGLDQSASYVRGRCVNPNKLPLAIIPNRFYDITYDFGQGTQSGRIYLQPSTRGRLGLDEVFGDQIVGYIVTQGGI